MARSGRNTGLYSICTGEEHNIIKRARVSEDKPKERLPWFHTTIWNYSGNRIIVLVSLRSYDTHLSLTFISEIQRIPTLL